MTVTYVYYSKTYGGLAVEESDFSNLVKRSERKLQAVIGRPIALDQLPEAVRQFYRQAVCAQIEYFQTMGVEASLGVADVTSARIGNFSYTAGKTSTSKTSLTGLAPDAEGYLAQAGLLYKGVMTRW